MALPDDRNSMSRYPTYQDLQERLKNLTGAFDRDPMVIGSLKMCICSLYREDLTNIPENVTEPFACVYCGKQFQATRYSTT